MVAMMTATTLRPRRGRTNPPLHQKAEEEGPGKGGQNGQGKGQEEGEGVGEVSPYQEKLPDGEVDHAGGPVNQDEA
jgi:hypothetical protein